jgi:hypothetical protein
MKFVSLTFKAYLKNVWLPIDFQKSLAGTKPARFAQLTFRSILTFIDRSPRLEREKKSPILFEWVLQATSTELDCLGAGRLVSQQSLLSRSFNRTVFLTSPYRRSGANGMTYFFRVNRKIRFFLFFLIAGKTAKNRRFLRARTFSSPLPTAFPARFLRRFFRRRYRALRSSLISFPLLNPLIALMPSRSLLAAKRRI